MIQWVLVIDHLEARIFQACMDRNISRRTLSYPQRNYLSNRADRVGVEPTEPLEGSLDFESSALNHSATCPGRETLR